jgi:hypothetical protein
MKRRHTLVISLIWMLSLALVGTLTAQASHFTAPQVAASTAFTHQGQIRRNGTLFTGACDMQFSLWDDAANGAQQGATATVNAVNVADGVFAMQLDFGHQFKGEARWLETAVRCADDADFTTLPRQALTAVPYAISLLPGAVISGTGDLGLMINTPNGNALAAYGKRDTYAVIYGNDSSPNGGYGVFGLSNRGPGVYASSTFSNGVQGYGGSGASGVYGKNNYVNSSGVKGEANASGSVGVYGTSTGNTGVFGVSTSGNGVWGQSTNGSGVYARSTNGDAIHVESAGKQGLYVGTAIQDGVRVDGAGLDGVYANGGAGNSGVFGNNFNNNSIGVKGRADGAGSVGVWGESSSNTGVYGLSTSGNGVWGKSTSGFAMRADGNTMQSLNSGGWVKAMVYVDPSLPTGQQIVRCFNSQLAGSAATTAPCGFSTTGASLGQWDVDFGFDVSQRFATMSTLTHTSLTCNDGQSFCPIVGTLWGLAGTKVFVVTKYSNNGDFTNAPFMLILY